MLSWDEKICGIFDIPVCALAEVCDSDAVYGMTTMERAVLQNSGAGYVRRGKSVW